MLKLKLFTSINPPTEIIMHWCKHITLKFKPIQYLKMNKLPSGNNHTK